MLNHKHATTVAVIYFLNVSVIVVLFYGWRVSLNLKKGADLKDVYYGVQFAYCAIIGTHILMICLSILLSISIYRENISSIHLWTVTFLALLALEAVLMMYSNILRDHVNKKFDELCESEVIFFCIRLILNVIAIRSVMNFVNNLRLRSSWKEEPESIRL